MTDETIICNKKFFIKKVLYIKIFLASFQKFYKMNIFGRPRRDIKIDKKLQNKIDKKLQNKIHKKLQSKSMVGMRTLYTYSNRDPLKRSVAHKNSTV